MFRQLKKHRFLLEELVKRDFKHKYKGTVLGVGWSLLSPLLTLLVMKVVFTQFFGRDAPHSPRTSSRASSCSASSPIRARAA